jgi:hypothetical protein
MVNPIVWHNAKPATWPHPKELLVVGDAQPPIVATHDVPNILGYTVFEGVGHSSR